jgi:hypothetical protein
MKITFKCYAVESYQGQPLYKMHIYPYGEISSYIEKPIEMKSYLTCQNNIIQTFIFYKNKKYYYQESLSQMRYIDNINDLLNLYLFDRHEIQIFEDQSIIITIKNFYDTEIYKVTAICQS